MNDLALRLFRIYFKPFLGIICDNEFGPYPRDFKEQREMMSQRDGFVVECEHGSFQQKKKEHKTYFL